MADKLVTIAEYMDSMQAEMAKQVLADFGIKSTLMGQHGTDVLAGVPAFATVKLQVLESDTDKAKQILEEQKQSFKPEESPEFNELGGYEEPEEQ